MEILEAWKKDPERLPLIIRGARQVGKTWLMREFGSVYFEKYAYINFDHNPRMQQLFSGDFNIDRILQGLIIEGNVDINPENTLIILDEVQEVPAALQSLKYFVEDGRHTYFIVAACSLLGIALHSGTSFPVGKVDHMDLYPLSFREFLCATGNEGLKELLDRQDFSKHAPIEVVPRIQMVWDGILSQLAKENRKFIYSVLREGARAKDFELAIQWMNDCGLCYKVGRVKKGAVPLKAYQDLQAFKLYLLDVGLLAAMADLDAKTLLKGNDIFTEFKGVLTEQYVCQQLLAEFHITPYYWSAQSSSGEVDFVLQHNGSVIPVEVKAKENLNAKSLKYFVEASRLGFGIRTSMSDYRVQEKLINLPLYALSCLWDVCDKSMQI